MKKIITVVFSEGLFADGLEFFSYLKRWFYSHGIPVYTISKPSADFSRNGILFGDSDRPLRLEYEMFRLQIQKENTFLELVRAMDGDKALLIIDRGIADTLSELTPAQLEDFAVCLGSSVSDVLNRYDVIYSASHDYSEDVTASKIFVEHPVYIVSSDKNPLQLINTIMSLWEEDDYENS